MRVRTAAGLLACGMLILATAGPASHAQVQRDMRYPHLQQPHRVAPHRVAPQPVVPHRVDPRRGTIEVAPAPVQPRPFYVPFWGNINAAPPPPVEEPRRATRPRAPREATREPAVRGGEQRAAEPRRAEPRPQRQRPAEVQPVEIKTHIVVFGDSLAHMLADGLSEAVSDAPEIGVTNEAKGSSGLVRDDFHDWPSAIAAYLESGKKLDLAVMMVGINDRQPIRDGGVSHEPLSERWRELYGERVGRIATLLAERRVPLIWVGVPAMKNERLSTDLIAVNEIVRGRVQQAGGVFVDIWEGFVDDENRYSVTGPDVVGQITRLRAGDGVHFTAAGARKAAHFANVEIRRIVGRGPEPATVSRAVVGTDVEPTQRLETIERMIQAAVPELPPVPGIEAPPPVPKIGPVVPLTRVEVTPGGTLVAGRPALDSSRRYLNERVLEDGLAPPPQPGRADDFRWPPAGR